MENKNMTTQQIKTPDMVKTVGDITFIVRAHFREDAGETMQEKIKRMLRSEVVNAVNFDEIQKMY